MFKSCMDVKDQFTLFNVVNRKHWFEWILDFYRHDRWPHRVFISLQLNWFGEQGLKTWSFWRKRGTRQRCVHKEWCLLVCLQKGSSRKGEGMSSHEPSPASGWLPYAPFSITVLELCSDPDSSTQVRKQRKGRRTREEGVSSGIDSTSPREGWGLQCFWGEFAAFWEASDREAMGIQGQIKGCKVWGTGWPFSMKELPVLWLQPLHNRAGHSWKSRSR